MKLIIVVSLLFLCCVGSASAWYDGFDYRIPITINNTENPALEHYQFNVSFPLGINETSIRVVNDIDYTIVPHWCENETAGLCYELWFNLSVGSEINTDYYIYYGNDSISSTSDYDGTFTKKYNDSGLVLELHIDEGSGNTVTVDSSGGGNHGTLTNMNVTGNATSGWQGADGGQWDNRSDVTFSTGDHLQFDGVNDYVNCGNDSSLDAPTSITVLMGVKVEGAAEGVTPGIISKRNDGFGLIWMDQAETKIYSRIWESDGTAINMGVFAISQNTYHQIVLTADDTDNKVRVYLDCVEQGAAKTYDGTIKTGVSDLLLGAQSSQSFNGTIDEVRIYNRSLSKDEIYRQYIYSKYAANTPLISMGYTEKIPHPFLSGAHLFYEEMAEGLTGFKDGMGRYLIWGVVFFAVSLAFALIAKIKTTLIGGK